MIIRHMLYNLYTAAYITYQEKSHNFISSGEDQWKSIDAEGRWGTRRKEEQFLKLGSNCVR